MPLVVPGVTTQSGDKTEEWRNKLTGKKLHDGEESNETVSSPEQSCDLKATGDKMLTEMPPSALCQARTPREAPRH